jgi:hypothetical protein
VKGDRWDKLAPLTGIVFVALVVIAFVAIGRSTPGTHAAATKVQAFYSKHHGREEAAAFVIAIGALFFAFFGAVLYRALRSAGGSGRLAAAAFGGNLIAVTGFGILATVHIALSEAGKKAVTLSTVQTLSVLDNNDFIPMALGIGIMILASGLAVVRHGGLPRWLGWAALVLGVASFTPAGFFAFILSGVWVIAVSIVLYLRGPEGDAEPGYSPAQA